MKRTPLSSLHFLIGASAVAACIAGAIFYFSPGESDPGPAPNINALRGVLERSAEEALPAPSVAREEITLETLPAERDSAADRIVAIAAQLGGTALRGESEEGSDILAQIPVARLGEFRALVTGGKPAAAAEPPAGDAVETDWVVVKLVRPATSPSPTATPR